VFLQETSSETSLSNVPFHIEPTFFLLHLQGSKTVRGQIIGPVTIFGHIGDTG